jgi:hypothetical protein
VQHNVLSYSRLPSSKQPCFVFLFNQSTLSKRYFVCCCNKMTTRSLFKVLQQVESNHIACITPVATGSNIIQPLSPISASLGNNCCCTFEPHEINGFDVGSSSSSSSSLCTTSAQRLEQAESGTCELELPQLSQLTSDDERMESIVSIWYRRWNGLIHAIASRSFYSFSSICMILINKSLDKRYAICPT